MSESENFISYPDYSDPNFSGILNKYEFNNVNKKNHIYQEPSQLLLRNFISKNTIYENLLMYHSVGSGKCMKKDTPIIMFDGSIKMVQDIQKGELLMGDNSTPRTVLSTTTGEDEMYDIIPVKGEKYTVNQEHILCLKASEFPKITYRNNNYDYNIQWIENNKFMSKTFTFEKNDVLDKKEKEKSAMAFKNSISCEQILEIAVKDYIKLSKSKKSILKGYRVKIEFPEKELPFDPYMIGVLLGDSSMITNQGASEYIDKINSTESHYKFITDLLNNKHIPMNYKCNSRENRLKLLAGLLDSDKNINFDFIQKSEGLIDDIIYLCRSLGFACYKSKQKKGVDDYYRICISGEGLDEIPILCPRKQKIEKDVLVTEITVKHIGRDQYYGFTLDDNCRYILGDFTVTHNTCSSITIAEGFKEYILNMGRKIIVIVKNKNIQKNFINELLGQCTYDTYLTPEERKLYFSTESKSGITHTIQQGKKKELVNKTIRTIGKNYQFITYGSFTNRVLGARDFEKDKYGNITSKIKKINGIVQRKKIKDEIRNFNNTVIIIDEAHNVTNNDVYTALYQVLSRSYNYRLVLLTATPIYDNPREIFELSNLLNINYPNNQLSIRKDLFKDNLVQKETSNYINENIIKGGVISVTELGKEKFINHNYYSNIYYKFNITVYVFRNLIQ